MGVKKQTSRPARAFYPSGPRLDGKSTYYEQVINNRNPCAEVDINPDPRHYKILKVVEFNGFVLMMLEYSNCTNYEGKKILLFKASLLDLINQRVIDPHFFEDEKILSPIARFVPTEDGWSMGLKIIGK